MSKPNSPLGDERRRATETELDLEPIKRRLLIHDEEIENSSEISYAEWEDNNDILADRDVKALFAEVERLKQSASDTERLRADPRELRRLKEWILTIPSPYGGTVGLAWEGDRQKLVDLLDAALRQEERP